MVILSSHKEVTTNFCLYDMLRHDFSDIGLLHELFIASSLNSTHLQCCASNQIWIEVDRG